MIAQNYAEICMASIVLFSYAQISLWKPQVIASVTLRALVELLCTDL